MESICDSIVTKKSFFCCSCFRWFHHLFTRVCAPSISLFGIAGLSLNYADALYLSSRSAVSNFLQISLLSIYEYLFSSFVSNRLPCNFSQYDVAELYFRHCLRYRAESWDCKEAGYVIGTTEIGCLCQYRSRYYVDVSFRIGRYW